MNFNQEKEAFMKRCEARRKEEALTPEEIAQRKVAARNRKEEYERKLKAELGELYSIHKRRIEGGKDPRQCLNIPILMNLNEKEADKWKEKLKTVLVDDEARIVEYYEKVRQDGRKDGVLDNDYPNSSVLKLHDTEPKVEIIQGEVIKKKSLDIMKNEDYTIEWKG